MSEAQRNPIKNIVLIQYAGLSMVTLAVLFGVQLAFGNMLTAANFEVMAMNVVFEGIMALGMTFVILMGGIDLSVASVFAFAEIIVAKLMIQADLPVLPSVLITLMALCGDRRSQRHLDRPFSGSPADHYDGNAVDHSGYQPGNH